MARMVVVRGDEGWFLNRLPDSSSKSVTNDACSPRLVVVEIDGLSSELSCAILRNTYYDA